jgi:hypothetical protein
VRGAGYRPCRGHVMLRTVRSPPRRRCRARRHVSCSSPSAWSWSGRSLALSSRTSTRRCPITGRRDRSDGTGGHPRESAHRPGRPTTRRPSVVVDGGTVIAASANAAGLLDDMTTTKTGAGDHYRNGRPGQRRAVSRGVEADRDHLRPRTLHIAASLDDVTRRSNCSRGHWR